jgi:hypothetical protein
MEHDSGKKIRAGLIQEIEERLGQDNAEEIRAELRQEDKLEQDRTKARRKKERKRNEEIKARLKQKEMGQTSGDKGRKR